MDYLDASDDDTRREDGDSYSEGSNNEKADLKDVLKSRVIYESVDPHTMRKVIVKLKLDHDAIKRLLDKTAIYHVEYIKNCLPAHYFDDAKEECEGIKEQID